MEEKLAGCKDLIKEAKYLVDLVAKEQHELSLRLLLNLALTINEVDTEKDVLFLFYIKAIIISPV